MAIKRYSDKEQTVFLWVILPYTVVINFMSLGDCPYASLSRFFLYTGVTMVYFFSGYFIFGLVGGYIHRKIPNSQDLLKRIGLMLPVFYCMNIFLMLGFFAVYNHIVVSPCAPGKNEFLWVFLFGCFASTVITFLNEGVVNWSKWKNAVTETEQLKSAYQKSKLYGLKGQINPHFLFNCFNSLSSLISENEEQAELFLNEMTKVHRYLLRTDDEQLVELKEELKFARSYLHLIAVRFGAAIQYDLNVPAELMEKQLPPLSLQVILENVIYTNIVSKSQPLFLLISADPDQLIIRNSLQPKTMCEEGTMQEGLDNLITKYRLMGQQEIQVEEKDAERVITLPLFNKPLSFQ
ncbi:MAG: histidine kinase [Chitinophagaceae bacterium]|nr:histidine kinase [Chitinophagaceae bacterium]